MAKRKKRAVRPTPKPDRDGIPIGDPEAPVEGSDAGDASDLRAARTRRTITEYRSSANRHLQSAKRLVGQAPAAAEHEARAAIADATRAFWWAEGTELEETQHTLMHSIGHWTREHFECQLEFDGSTYRRTCPIDIAHIRAGLSVGFVARRICSICDADLSECPHLRDRSYWVRGGSHDGHPCPVCLGEHCRHRFDRLYRASVVAVVKEMEGREVSWVRQPANPEARPHAIPATFAQLSQALGPRFEKGMPVSCDKCQPGRCWGFSEFGPTAGHSGPLGRVVSAGVTDRGEMDVTLEMPEGFVPPL